MVARPKWDNIQSYELRKRYINIFKRNINTIMIRYRAAKRLTLLKARLKNEHVKTREDCVRMVKEDCKSA